VFGWHHAQSLSNINILLIGGPDKNRRPAGLGGLRFFPYCAMTGFSKNGLPANGHLYSGKDL
jgi:hypothetical protein